MKRSDALKLIANKLDFLNKNFNGFRDNFSEDELKNSDVILTTLQDAGMLPPLAYGYDSKFKHYAPHKTLQNMREEE